MRLTRYDGPSAEEEVLLSKSEKCKVETFVPIIDTLIFELTKRAEAYSQIGNLFSFFCELKTIASDDFRKSENIWLLCMTKTVIMMTF